MRRTHSQIRWNNRTINRRGEPGLGWNDSSKYIEQLVTDLRWTIPFYSSACAKNARSCLHNVYKFKRKQSMYQRCLRLTYAMTVTTVTHWGRVRRMETGLVDLRMIIARESAIHSELTANAVASIYRTLDDHSSSRITECSLFFYIRSFAMFYAEFIIILCFIVSWQHQQQHDW